MTDCHAALSRSHRRRARRAKHYKHDDKRVEVLKGVSLDIHAGEVVSIVGPSGAGKTTLLHLIGTLDQPTRGTVRITARRSLDVGVRVAALRNQAIGFVFQFHHLLPEFTALENVMMPGLIKGGSRRDAEARAEPARRGGARASGHRTARRRCRAASSSAWRWRGRWSRAEAASGRRTDGNLDTANSETMNELFFRLNRQFGTTMVIVTHNEVLAARVPRMVKMRDGRIVDDIHGMTPLTRY